MEALVEQGLTRQIGVSNFNVSLLRQLLNFCRVRPSVNQIESHPYFRNDVLIRYCVEHGIRITAYSPLGGAYDYGKNAGISVLKDETIGRIAASHDISPAAVIINWHFQRGHAPRMYEIITKTSRPETAERNFNYPRVQLSAEEMSEINGLDRGQAGRFNDAAAVFWETPLFD